MSLYGTLLVVGTSLWLPYHYRNVGHHPVSIQDHMSTHNYLHCLYTPAHMDQMMSTHQCLNMLHSWILTVTATH